MAGTTSAVDGQVSTSDLQQAVARALARRLDPAGAGEGGEPRLELATQLLQCDGVATFEVESGSAKDWDTLVESIKDGSVEADRVDGAPAPAESILTFAEQCSACAGALPPAVKGQVTLTCPYCGTVNHPVG